ncbi:MAG: hypothetical protein IID18_05935, partial [Nitrospinae bacterium]|nr:hypothetical protein [Nitrospinota bacterium]
MDADMESGEEKKSWWKRLQHWWDSKGAEEQKRLRSFIPLFLYAVAVIYGVMYLSILNTVNRGKGMTAIKTWYGGDRPEIVRALKAEKDGLDNDAFDDAARGVVEGRRINLLYFAGRFLEMHGDAKAANAYLGMRAGLTVAATFPAAVVAMAALRGFKGT